MAGYILLGGAFTGAMVLLSVTRLEEGKTKRFALWGGLLLVLILEYALLAMWYALRLKERRDTAALNQGLRRFQEET